MSLTVEQWRAKKAGATAPVVSSAPVPTPVAPTAPKTALTVEEWRAKKAGTPAAQPTINLPDVPNQFGNSNSTAQIAKPETSVLAPPLRWLGKQLNKSVAATSAIEEGFQTGNVSSIPKNVGDVLAGRSDRSFGTRIQEAYKDDPKKAVVAGLVADIFLDPLTYTGVGALTKVGKLAKIVTALKAAGMTIEEGSKIANMIDKSGKTAEQLTLAATKSEQALKGQRSAVTFMGKPAVPAKVSEKIFNVTDKIGAGATKLPFVGATVEKARGLFNTTTGNAEVDALLERTRHEQDYKTAKIMEEAIDTEKQMLKAGVTADKQIEVANYLEKGIMPSNKILHAIAVRHHKLYKDMIGTEIAAGIKSGEHSFYYPHVPVKETETAAEKFRNFLTPRKYSTTLGSSESRDIKKFQAENGHELIGKAGDLGLKSIPSVKGLSHAITWGQFKTLKDVEDMLIEHGITLTYKPQRLVKGNALGYFNPIKKEIVIATARPNIDKVMETLKHEITHNAHFQIAGNIEMFENFAGAGRRTQPWLKALGDAKQAAREEWRSILLSVNGITPEDFARMSKADQQYYTEPTELLARVGQSYLQNPDIAKLRFPKSIEAFEQLRKQNKLFDILNTQPPKRGAFIQGEVYAGKGGELYQAINTGLHKAGVEEINKAYKKPIFEENPALALAHRGTASAKAVASGKLFQDVRKFATDAENGVEVKVPELKGLKFEPGVAKQLDSYYSSIQPENLATAVKAIDAVQGLWKTQALFSTGYHLRNATGNLWNNFLAGIKNPAEYANAMKVQNGKDFTMVTDAGTKLTGPEILELAKKNGVIDSGQFTADIDRTIEAQVKGGNFNPLSSENYLFRGNRKVGSAVENNAKLTNFMHQLQKGLPPLDASREVKKYLFDYADLTDFEKGFMKRIMPFYTWTRKNLPVQVEAIMEQPGKFAGAEKVIGAVESQTMAGAPDIDEKYLSDYIKNNTPMRVGYNEKDRSANYFLLGAWVPSYAAMNFIDQPMEQMWGMVSPFIKTPIAYGTNKDAFFKNSLDEYQKIEKFPGDSVNFMGVTMPKKTAMVLRNIKLLNDLDKANPGLIFGGTKGQKSIWAKMGLPAVNVPGMGNLSPAQFKYNPKTGVVPSAGVRAAGFFTGKSTTYKEKTSQEYYRSETDQRVAEMERAVSKAKREGDLPSVKKLKQEIKDFKEMRGK
jgi:hypothetical protein